MNSKLSYLILLILFLNNNLLESQNIKACDFFPKEDKISMTFIEKKEGGLLGNSFKKFKIEYVYQNNIEIKGKSYKVYNKYVDGEIPEVNQQVLVHCNANELVIGNEIYAFNREVIGEMKDITKVVDFYATPIYEISMQPTGNYYLPTVLRIDKKAGVVWTNETEMHNKYVKIKSQIISKDTTIVVNDIKFDKVYQINQKFYTENDLISEKDIYYAYELGMIKMVSKSNLLGREITNTIEFYNPQQFDKLIEEIKSDLDILPKESVFHEYFKSTVNLVDALPPEQARTQLIELKNQISKVAKQETKNNKSVNDYESLKEKISLNPKIKKELLGTWKEKTKGISHFTFYENGTLKIYGIWDKKKYKIPNEKYWYTITNELELEILFEERTALGYPNYRKYQIKMIDDKSVVLELIYDYVYEVEDKSKAFYKTFNFYKENSKEYIKTKL